jgi:two-component system nitrate/nitrite response regulator NarL
MDKSADVVRILIADDHPILRDGLRKLLEAERDLRVIGEAADGVEAIKAVRRLKPDVLLLDLRMPRLTGLEALREIGVCSTRTVVLAASIEKAQVAEAIRLGARGVVLKESATELLLKCIRAVMAGQYWVGHEVVCTLVEAVRDVLPANGKGQNAPSHFGITQREQEVIVAVVNGYMNKDIARSYAVSIQTVKHHLTNIYDKLGVSNRLELALFAVNHHLVDRTTVPESVRSAAERAERVRLSVSSSPSLGSSDLRLSRNASN